jgi:hypothetical protein
MRLNEGSGFLTPDGSDCRADVYFWSLSGVKRENIFVAACTPDVNPELKNSESRNDLNQHCVSTISRIPALNDRNMDQTITSIDTITLRFPLDIWAPPPMSQGVPRTHVESLYVRVQTSGGVVGWGESFGTARPMVIAAFDNWIKRLAIGQKVSDTTSSRASNERFSHSVAPGRWPTRWRVSTSRCGTFAASLRVCQVSTLLGGAKANPRRMLRLFAAIFRQPRIHQAQYRPCSRTRLSLHQAA